MSYTIQELAEAMGLSVSTVYRCLNHTGYVSEKTRARVQEYADKVGFKPNSIAQGLARRKRIHIVAVYGQDPIEWWSGTHIGVKAVVDELSDFGATVTFITYRVGSHNTVIGLLNVLKSQTVDGLVLVPSQHPEILESIQYAKDHGIPLACVNADIQDINDRLFYFGPEEYRVGKLIADLIGTILKYKKKGTVSLFGAETTDTYRFIRRQHGVYDQLTSDYPDITIKKTYSVPRAGMYQSIEHILSGPDCPDVLYAYDFSALYPLAEAVKNLGKRSVTVIGHETTDDIRRMIKEGWITASFCQETFTQGYYPLKYMFNFLSSGTPVNDCYYSNVNFRFKSNIDLTPAKDDFNRLRWISTNR